MVCTLLAGVNVVAFAADDDETVSVSKFYNDAKKGGDGEHLFTKDADEISWLSSLKTWNNEGEAWKAPVSSSTSVWRCYNPNSGEHLYVDEGYADYLAGSGWNKEKVAFYSDDNKGVPVYRLWNGLDGVGSHHFTTDAGEVDWLVGQGWTKEDVAFYGVANASNVVALTDVNGLQADGTALVSDTLQIVFGSTFGTPASVSWYKDGAVIQVKTSSIEATDLRWNAKDKKTGTGTYYAVVENTKGQSFTTNSIIVSDETYAVISGFGIEDNYEALQKYADDTTNNVAYAMFAPQVNQETDLAVVTVTLNRDYVGDFYLVEADATEFSDIKASNKFTPVAHTAADGNIVTVEKKEFSNAGLAKATIGALADDTSVQAIKYVADDGTVSYKFYAELEENSGNKLTRGEDYMIIFDQDDSVTTGSTIEDWNVSDEFTCPYLYAPTSISVTNAQATTKTGGWELTAYLGTTQAAWINEDPEDKVDMTLYTNDEISVLTGTPFSDNINYVQAGVGKYDDGVDDSAAKADVSANYVYGTLEADEGIFGEDELVLVSDVVTTPDKVVETVTVEPNELLAGNMEVTFSKLRGNATVFLIGGTASDQVAGDTQISDYVKALTEDEEYVSVAHVTAGTTSYTFENVIKKMDNEIDPEANGDIYAVLVVPDDTETYTKNMSAPVTVQQQVSGYTVGGTLTGLKAATGTSIATKANMQAVDQYGQKMETTALPADVPMTLTTKFNDQSTDQTIMFNLIPKAGTDASFGFKSTDANTYGAYAQKGDVYTYKISPLQTIVLTCTKSGQQGTAEFTLSVK